MRESERIETIFPTGELAIAVNFATSPPVAEFLTLWKTLTIDTIDHGPIGIRYPIEMQGHSADCNRTLVTFRTTSSTGTFNHESQLGVLSQDIHRGRLTFYLLPLWALSEPSLGKTNS